MSSITVGLNACENVGRFRLIEAAVAQRIEGDTRYVAGHEEASNSAKPGFWLGETLVTRAELTLLAGVLFLTGGCICTSAIVRAALPY